METIDLNLLRAFTAVHDTGSFSLAADQLSVPRSTVSRAVASLEGALGVRLFHRTTRQVSTTTAGLSLYGRVAPSLKQLKASLSELPEREEEPSGTLRVTTAVDLGAAVLAEAGARFTARWPKADLDVHVTNDVVDLVRDGYDLALRISGTPLHDSSLVATKVGTITACVYAAPSYLARRGTPRSPDEVCSHDWVAFRGKKDRPFFGTKAKVPSDVKPRILADDMFFAREALKHGAGIGLLPSFLADADVAAGRLVELFPAARSSTVFLVHPSRKQVPRKVTAFREAVLDVLKRSPLSPSL